VVNTGSRVPGQLKTIWIDVPLDDRKWNEKIRAI